MVALLSSLKPTARQRVGRPSSYLVGIIFIVLVIVVADWPTIAKQFAEIPEVAAKMWPGIVTIALRNTLLYTIASFILFGSLLGILLAVLKVAGGPLGWSSRSGSSSSSAGASRPCSRSSPSRSSCRSRSTSRYLAGRWEPVSSASPSSPGRTPPRSPASARGGVTRPKREAQKVACRPLGQTMFWIILPQACGS
ncbi:MAG: hypothetical protein U0R79_03235 [Propionicimonas sp.]